MYMYMYIYIYTCLQPEINEARGYFRNQIERGEVLFSKPHVTRRGAKCA